MPDIIRNGVRIHYEEEGEGKRGFGSGPAELLFQRTDKDAPGIDDAQSQKHEESTGQNRDAFCADIHGNILCC